MVGCGTSPKWADTNSVALYANDYQAFPAFSAIQSPIPFTLPLYTVSKTPPLTTEANMLVLIAAEANARRKVAKLAGIQSGTLPVLALVVYRRGQGKISRPAAVYAANIANEPLVRSYIRQLVAADLLALTVRRGRRTLAPTLGGLALAAKYYRAVREGRNQINTQD